LSNDVDIIRRILSGQINDYEILVERYSRQVFAIVYKRVPKSDVEEVAQEIFVDVYRSLPTFKARKPFSHWLSRIAVRKCCDYWRKLERKKEMPASAFSDMHDEWLAQAAAATSQAEFDQLALKKEAQELLEAAVAGLKPEDQLAIDLLYMQGWSVKETADAMDWSLSKTKVRALRARHTLRHIIKTMLEQDNE
jgi:RNA polymerase sigma-70 factor (ECF subfamily)